MTTLPSSAGHISVPLPTGSAVITSALPDSVRGARLRVVDGGFQHLSLHRARRNADADCGLYFFRRSAAA